MKRHAVYGCGAGIHGREAALQATQRALDEAGAARPVLALVFFSQEFDYSEVHTGVTGLLGETPLWGFSTIHPLTNDGDQPRSVVVALVFGSENRASALWFPGYAQDSNAAARQLVQALQQEEAQHTPFLLAADGVQGSLLPVCAALEGFPAALAGCMASGDPSLGRTYQMGKNQVGAGGLSALLLGGRLRLGVGVGHGWRDLGLYFRATRTRDVWVHSLDQMTAAEAYAQCFGNTARQWALPPLTEIVRLYPLGVERSPNPEVQPFLQTDPAQLILRAPLRVEVDGSLRMSAPLPEGAVVHLMTGDPDACVYAAKQAAAAALRGLGENVRPLLAVALVDAAWQMLLETRPNAIAGALNSAIGDLPLVGAYTYGQLVRPALDQPPVLHNQNILVAILGEEQDETR